MLYKSSITPELIIPKLIIGLGNPEAKYKQTRHNIGFEAIDIIAKYWQVPMKYSDKFNGELNTISNIFSTTLLFKPLSGMNLSGQGIQAIVDWSKLPLTSVLIIYDDMNLPLGQLRLRISGSAGGHNGMKSIISYLGTQDFPRLRIGIGKPELSNDFLSHVLGEFSLLELSTLEHTLEKVIEVVNISINRGIEYAMNICNN